MLTIRKAQGASCHVGVHPTLPGGLRLPLTCGGPPGGQLGHSIKEQLGLASVKPPGDSHMMPVVVLPVKKSPALKRAFCTGRLVYWPLYANLATVSAVLMQANMMDMIYYSPLCTQSPKPCSAY